MALLQSTLSKHTLLDNLPEPANCDAMMPSITPDQKIISWLFRIKTQKRTPTSLPDNESAATTEATSPFEKNKKFLIERAQKPLDDWQAVSSISGLSVQDIVGSGALLPLTAAEIDHFLRNHRETDRLVGRDFLSLKSDLPTPVAELYGLYKHRARLDTEAAFFVAQATGSTRIARTMADLLAIAAFASGHECIAHSSVTYSVPAAFDTSDLIDRSCDEAMRRFMLPIETPSHLLKLSPDEISVLANNIVERYALTSAAFLDKASTLSEARQDVHRLRVDKQFSTAFLDGDLPKTKPWVHRIYLAYQSILPLWTQNIEQQNRRDISATIKCDL